MKLTKDPYDPFDDDTSEEDNPESEPDKRQYLSFFSMSAFLVMN